MAGLKCKPGRKRHSEGVRCAVSPLDRAQAQNVNLSTEKARMGASSVS